MWLSGTGVASSKEASHEKGDQSRTGGHHYRGGSGDTGFCGIQVLPATLKATVDAPAELWCTCTVWGSSDTAIEQDNQEDKP